MIVGVERNAPAISVRGEGEVQRGGCTLTGQHGTLYPRRGPQLAVAVSQSVKATDFYIGGIKPN